MTAEPYVGFSNKTLAKLKPLKPGDRIRCPHCRKKHEVTGDEQMMFYRCQGRAYMAGVDGKNTIGVDVSGSFDFDEP